MAHRQLACGLLLAASALIPLSGCGSDEKLAADDAVTHYDAVAQDLAEALGEPDTRWQFTETMRGIGIKDDVCRYRPGLWTPDPRLQASDDATWRAWMDAVNPVLEEHGFTSISDVTQDEALQRLTSSDQHGAQLVIENIGSIRVYDVAVDADPCELETLGVASTK